MPANLHFPNNTPAFLSYLHNVHSHLAIFHSPQTPHDYPLYTRKNNCECHCTTDDNVCGFTLYLT